MDIQINVEIELQAHALDCQIDTLKAEIVENNFMSNIQKECLEDLIDLAIKLGELYGKRDAVPEGYHLVKKPKPLIGNNNVDFSLAPEWANFWLKDGYSNKYWWSNVRPKMDLDIGCFVFPSNYKALEAPDFGFNGDWTKSITSRKAKVA